MIHSTLQSLCCLHSDNRSRHDISWMFHEYEFAGQSSLKLHIGTPQNVKLLFLLSCIRMLMNGIDKCCVTALYDHNCYLKHDQRVNGTLLSKFHFLNAIQ